MVFYRVAAQQRPGLLLKSGFSLTRVEHGGSGAVGSTCCFTFSQLAEKLWEKCKHKSVSCVTLPLGLVQARAIGTSCVAKTTMRPARALPAGPGALRAPHHCYLQAPSLCGTALGSQVSVQTCFEVLGLLFGKTKYMQPAVFSASILLSAYCFY